MKTLNDVTQEIELIISKTSDGVSLSKKHMNGLRKRVSFLKDCKLYLESEPSEQFVRNELDRMNTLLVYIKTNLPDFVKSVGDDGRTYTQKKSEWFKKMNRATVIKQIRTLKFLLND